MSSNAFLVKMKLSFSLGFAVILMATVGTASYFTISGLIEAAHTELQTQNKLVLVERAAFGIKAAEVSLRQYLLSGNAIDLEKIGRRRRGTIEPERWRSTSSNSTARRYRRCRQTARA